MHTEERTAFYHVPFFFLLAPLILVSCVNFSGKPDSVGRRDALMDGSRVVSERYRVGDKRYIPVTLRYVEAHEPWMYLNAATKERTCALRGGSEPQGEERRYFLHEVGISDLKHRELVPEKEFPLAQVVREPAAPVTQDGVLPADIRRGNRYYRSAGSMTSCCRRIGEAEPFSFFPESVQGDVCDYLNDEDEEGGEEGEK